MSARFCVLSDIIIAVLSGETIESKGEEHAREQQWRERPSKQDMEGAPVGVGASATPEWGIEDEEWGI